MKTEQKYYRTGFWLSAAGHVLIVIFIVFELGPNMDLDDPEVYSITVDAGSVLGGVAQVPDPKKETQLAPVKNAPNQDKQEKKEEKVEQVKPEEKTEDAEVSTSEPTPVPAKPTSKPEPTAPPKKDTPKPVKTATPKPVKKEQKSQGDDSKKKYEAAMQRYLGESSDAGGKGFGAARTGGKGMGGGIERPPEFFMYQRLIMSRIKDAWNWYDTNAPLITQIRMEIDPDGQTRNVSVVRTSGNAQFDESVVRAVIKASPLPPPPVSVYEYFKSVRIAFDPRE